STQSQLEEISRVSTTDDTLLVEVIRNARQIFDENGWPAFDSYAVLDRSDLAIREDITLALKDIESLMRVPRRSVPQRPGATMSRDWSYSLAAIHTRGWLLA